jgi:hypothetical protein
MMRKVTGIARGGRRPLFEQFGGFSVDLRDG